MAKRVSKILLKNESYYVFSIKNASWFTTKDHKLELLGGTIGYSETPFEGLIRELEEEDISKTLSKKAYLLKPKPIEIIVNGEPHFIYYMSISNNEYKNLKHNTSESYGFELIKDNIILNKEELNKNISRFTWKTIQIFNNLKML